ncbi:MAG: hypothetical protein FWE95_05945, partial [Planctomycetaceae bacterium]|nr:hypothetical protein [Planctomycetaceae bacterium]
RFWAKNALFVKIPLQIVTPKNNDANRNSETKWVFSGTTRYPVSQICVLWDTLPKQNNRQALPKWK